MQHKKIKLFVLLFLSFGLIELQAQTMYVKEINGIQNTYSLSNISKLSFAQGSLIISQTNSNSDAYILNNLRYLSFSDSISVNIEPEEAVYHTISVFPNPVFNDLKIDLSNSIFENGTLKILSLEGKLLKTQQIAGLSILSVDLSHLPKGIYICHLSNEKEAKSSIIIKQ